MRAVSHVVAGAVEFRFEALAFEILTHVLKANLTAEPLPKLRGTS